MSFALATHTSILLMDEPTNGLDIPGKSQFRKFIAAGMDDEHTIVISTHQVRDVDKVLDHILIMDKSRILLNKSVNEITDNICFSESNDQKVPEDTIYSMPSMKGNYLVSPNTYHEDTELNLELLFNATLSEPEKIRMCFDQQQKNATIEAERSDK